MRAVVQRVATAEVTVNGQTVGRIGPGLVVLLAVAAGDGPDQLAWLSAKLVGLRIFADDEGRMNRAVQEIGGGMLIVSQFTLYGDVRKGKRPSFLGAAPPEQAEQLYVAFCDAVAALGVPVQRGIFGADMAVSLVNDGPVTLVVDTP
jgi:D-aminoacyl-tRNA deacylase